MRPELCDGCGSCVRACPQGRLRIGSGYIYVDTSACTGCFSCADVCPRGAIARRTPPTRPTVAHLPVGAELGKVVVGSRAEAKALRKAAEQVERERAREQRAADPVPGAGAVAGTPAPIAWSPAEALAVVACLTAALVAKQALIGSAAFSAMPASGMIAARSLVLGVFYAAQLAVLVFLARRRGVHVLDAYRLRVGEPVVTGVVAAAGLVVALLVATRFASTAWSGLAQALGWVPPAAETLSAVFGAGGAGLVLASVMVVVVGPVVEELTFRGVITGALHVRFGIRTAVVASAAVFAAYHLTPWVLVPTFVLGVALAWLSLARPTLWPAIALHATYNAVVVAAAFWLPRGPI